MGLRHRLSCALIRQLAPRHLRRRAQVHARTILRVAHQWTRLAGVLLLFSWLAGAASVRAKLPSDELLITPTTQGIFALPNSGVTLEIGYATVDAPAHLTVTRNATRTEIHAVSARGTALTRFEQPIIAYLPDREPLIVGWPGPIAAPHPAEHWLIVFDAHGIYAQPASDPAPDAILYLGPLEHYTPDLVQPTGEGEIRFEESPPRERAILRLDGSSVTALPTAAHAARYRDRFIPEDLGNPGGFMLLGRVNAEQLPTLVRALRATIPNDPDLPAPGVPNAPLRLILPFDCTLTWAISWGYHHSTPQNRFAVDFATTEGGGAGGQPVFAAHAGTLWVKRYGTGEQMIDVGFAARVIAADGFTSTVYGHLAPEETLDWWNIQASDVPDFEWIEVGPVAAGQLIGTAGRSGYATGPHIHFALWSWDQSLYLPVPLGPLFEFPRGLIVPPVRRAPAECTQYHT